MGEPHDHSEFVPGCFRCELSRDEVEPDVPSTGERWTLYLCGNCGSDNIAESNENDSRCGDCGEWMNAVAREVIPVEALAEARAAVVGEMRAIADEAITAYLAAARLAGYVTPHTGPSNDFRQSALEHVDSRFGGEDRG